MGTLFSAVDVSGLLAQCSTILIAFIGVSLLFVAYRYIRKCLSSGTSESFYDHTAPEVIGSYIREDGGTHYETHQDDYGVYLDTGVYDK